MNEGPRRGWLRLPFGTDPLRKQPQSAAALSRRVEALEHEVDMLKLELLEAQAFMPRLAAIVDMVSTDLREANSRPAGERRPDVAGTEPGVGGE